MGWRVWSRGGCHIAPVDGVLDEIEYHRRKKSLEWELESSLIPEVDAAREAGRLLADLPRLWAGATLQERHQLLTTIVDAVHIDLKDRKSIVSVKAKPAFQTVLLDANSDASISRTATSLVRSRVTIQPRRQNDLVLDPEIRQFQLTSAPSGS